MQNMAIRSNRGNLPELDALLTRDRRELIVADCNAIGLQIFGPPSSL